MKHQPPLFRLNCLFSLIGLAIVPALVSAGPADPAYTLTELGGLSSPASTGPTAINAFGDVVGQSSVHCGATLTLGCNRAFYYSASTGVMTQLGLRGDGSDVYYSFAFGINAAGDAVGTSPESVPDASYPGRAVLYTAGGGFDFLPVATPSVALAINDAGQVVGFKGPQPFGPTRAFLFDPTAGITDIHGEIPGAVDSKATAINAAGDVVGWFGRPLGTPYPLRRTAFLRHADGSMEFLAPPSGLDTDVEATGVNGVGQVVGATNLTSGDWPMKAVLWRGGTAYDLGTLEPPDPGVQRGAAALAINRWGQIVGSSYYYWECPGGVYCAVASHAFLYSGGRMRDLNDLIPSDSGWVLQTATAINDAGQIVGIATTPPDASPRSGAALLLTPIPATRIDNLIELIESFGLPKGTENSLVTKLEQAQKALAAGDVGTACNLLGAFINETEAQSGKKLSDEQADAMISNAEQIRAAIGCS
jgi:probable HAF family extracellular repeat protein